MTARMPADLRFMEHALALAGRAAEAGEVPVGALVVREERVIGEGWNRPIAAHDPSAHAEMVALRAAALSIGNYRLEGAILYVTLEPCAMCIGAAINARIARVVFGAWDPRAGACGSLLDLPRELKHAHRLDAFGGVMSAECGAALKRFFEARRS